MFKAKEISHAKALWQQGTEVLFQDLREKWLAQVSKAELTF
jgi:transposase